jgi:hypothetical protein
LDGTTIQQQAETINVSDVVFRDDLYPRLETSARTVQTYAEDLDVLPPIEVNQQNELIDGWHRWTAHKKAQAETIQVVVTETKSDAELLEKAIERNATHGLQLSQEDKRNMARQIYHATPERERDAKKAELARILSVGERTVRGWLSRIDKDAKEQRDRRIFEMWLACYGQQEIADAVGVSQGEVAKSIPSGNVAELNKPDRSAAEHATDFEPPIYNIWKQQTKTAGSSHFGNSEVRWVDNLLYLYTEPFDVVVDPFAGGGSTVDICRKRMRRFWVSDRIVQPELEKKVRHHDLIDEQGNVALPPLPRWKDVKLVYLDPPYWRQAQGEYSDDPADLANMDLERFNEALAGVINGFAKKLKNGDPKYIALIIQPTQWKADERNFVDHVGDMLRAIKLPVAMRYSVPYESQQCTAQMVDWAKANKTCLVLTRELVVWRVN